MRTRQAQLRLTGRLKSQANYIWAPFGLVICTDGVTEAPNPQGEEYGEVRLAELIQENSNLPVNELLAAIQVNVQVFSGAIQADGITLIVARCR